MNSSALTQAECSLEDVLITEELANRPARRNLASEVRALTGLMCTLESAPGAVQEKLTELVLKSCHADSAGISLLEGAAPEVFRWTAVQGQFARNLGGTIPRNDSPCGVVVDRNEVLLFRDSERFFSRLRNVAPKIHESLLAPFEVEGRPAGTVWAIKHSPAGRFDAEDARLLKSVAHVAAAAHQAARSRTLAEKARDASIALHPRLVQVSKMAALGEVAAGVAHELNQPLTAINNYARACARLLARGETDAQTLQSAMEEVSAQALRAGEIIRSLRDLAAPRTTESARSEPNGAVAAVIELLRADARSRNVRIVLQLADQLPAVKIEQTQLQHVMLNLLRNAIEALENGAIQQREVVVETRLTTEQDVELAVSDNGLGLPEVLRERMFDPFFSTKAGGTGLGVPISNTIVRAHGGRLSYETSPSGGACFRVRLPRSDG